MTATNFSTSSPATVDSYVISPSGASDGQCLVYDGTAYVPDDIVPVGTIEMWAGGPTPPHGWLLCDGTPYLWAQYTRLRDVVGIAYGGSTNTDWYVPNLISTSSTVVVPIGLDGGGTRGNSTTTFAAGNIAHNHSFTGSPYTSNDGGNAYAAHAHNNTTSDGGHTHTMQYVATGADADWPHSHQTGAVSNTHAHNYQRGTGTTNGAQTGFTNHGAHTVQATIHAHTHAASSNTSYAHTHNSSQDTMSHGHTWTASSIVSTSQGANHQHSVNVQPIYFIIKF